MSSWGQRVKQRVDHVTIYTCFHNNHIKTQSSRRVGEEKGYLLNFIYMELIVN